MSCTTTTITSIADVHALRGEWGALLEEARPSTVFQSWEWVVSWYEHFNQDGRLLVITARNERGELVGVVPFSFTPLALGVRSLSLLGKLRGLTEYNGAVIHPDYSSVVTEAVAHTLHQQSPRWDLLAFHNLAGDSPLAAALRDLPRRGYRTYNLERAGVRRPLPATWQEFYRSLHKSMRENLNNYVNRLKREGHEERLVVPENSDELDGALDIFFALHRLRAQSKLNPPHIDRFTTARSRAFLRTAARRLQEQGMFWPALLYVDGNPVAAQLCLIQGGCLYRYHSGFDPAWSRYGVMTVLTRRCIERAIEHGLGELDLLLHPNQEKLRWGVQPARVVTVVMASPRVRSRAAFEVFRGYRQMSRMLWRRGKSEVTPWRSEKVLVPEAGDLLLRRGDSGSRCFDASDIVREHDHKSHQAHHFDHEIKDPEFEVARPRGGGRFYTFLMNFKIGAAVSLTQRDLRGSTVLVVCAGSGMDAELLLKRGARVTCLDISEGALARARDRASRYALDYRLVAGDAEHLPFDTQAFDFAFVHDGMHHLDDPEAALREMARVSRHGVIITEPADARLTAAAMRLGLIEAREESGNVVYRLYPARLAPIFERLGFSTVRHKRYLMKYPHQPGKLFRLLDLPFVYPIARQAFLLLGVRLLGPVGNKLAFVALSDSEVGGSDSRAERDLESEPVQAGHT